MSAIKRYEVLPVDIGFWVTHAVFPVNSDNSICYCTSKERAIWVLNQLNLAAAHEEVVAVERTRVRTEEVKPLLDALRAVRGAGGCQDNCQRSDRYCREKCRAMKADNAALAAIVVVEAKQKEIL